MIEHLDNGPAVVVGRAIGQSARRFGRNRHERVVAGGSTADPEPAGPLDPFRPRETANELRDQFGELITLAVVRHARRDPAQP